MYKYFFILTILIFSCKSEDVKYYNHEKWQIPGGYNYSSLKGKPTEVKESLFVDLDDTTISAKGRFNNYDFWKFDNKGNLVYRKYSSNNDSFSIISEMTYDENGIQTNTYAKNDSSQLLSGRIKTTLLNDSTFMQKFFNSLGTTKWQLVSFNNTGNVVRVSIVQDSINLKNVISEKTQYYKNNVLRKVNIINASGNREVQNYFYSKDNFLDSIITLVDGKLSSKEIYFNNRYGDAIKYLEVGPNNDTTINVSLQYEYDQHGNWIKQLEKRNDYNNYDVMLGDTASKYSLIIREIKY